MFELRKVNPSLHDLLVFFSMHLLLFSVACWWNVSLWWAFPGLGLPSILLETCVKIKTWWGIPSTTQSTVFLILLETSIKVQCFATINWLLYFVILLETCYEILILLCSEMGSDKLQKQYVAWDVCWFFKIRHMGKRKTSGYRRPWRFQG